MVDFVPFQQVVPTDRNVPESPNTFGAATARSLGNVGDALLGFGGQLAENKLAKQALYDEVYANDANTDAMKRITALYSEYQKNKGKSAQDALPGFQNDLESVYQDAVNSMPNPQTRALLSKALRYTTTQYYNYSRAHADQQFSDWQNQSATSAASEMANQAALAVNNPSQMETFLAGSDDQVRKLFEQQHWDEDTINSKVVENRSTNLKNIINSVAATEPGRAQDMLEKYGTTMRAGDRLNVLNTLKTYNATEKAANIGDSILKGNGSALLAAPSEYRNMFIDAGQKNNVPAGLLAAVAQTESSFNPAAVGAETKYGTAKGMMQFLDSTAQRFGVNQFDAQSSINGAAQYLSSLMKRYNGNITYAVAAYNWGEGNVDRWIDNGANPQDMPAETQGYIAKVLGDTTASVPRADAIRSALDLTADQPDMQTRVLSYLQRQYDVEDAQYADLNRQMALQEKLRKQQEEAAVQGFLPQIYGDQQDPNLSQSILNSPMIDSETKIKLIGMVNRTGQPSPADSHQATLDIVRRINLPPGDPEKITSQKQLLDAYSQNLISNSDFEFVQKQFNNTKDEAGRSFGETSGLFLQGIKPQITGSNPMMGIIDKTGEENFYRFNYFFWQKVQDYRNNGKDPADLLNPAKPDYIGSPGNLAPFQKSLQDSSDYLASRLAGPVAPPVAVAPPTESPEDFLKKNEAPLAPLAPSPIASEHRPPTGSPDYLYRRMIVETLLDQSRARYKAEGKSDAEVEKLLEDERKDWNSAAASRSAPALFRELPLHQKLDALEKIIGR